MRIPLAAALLAVLATASPSAALAGDQCPDQRATQVPAASTDLLPYRSCRMHLHILGVVIGITGPRCPTGHLYVPAHSECLGELALHMRCDQEGSVAIQFWSCKCVPHTTQHVSFTHCECQYAGTLGFALVGMTGACN
jgi:hypothetical protein